MWHPRGWFNSAVSKLGSTVWLGLLVGGALAGYWWYVSVRTNEVHEFHLRELAHAAQQIENTVREAKGTVANWEKSKERVRVEEFDQRQPYLALDPGCKDLCIKAKDASFAIDAGAIHEELVLPATLDIVFWANSAGKVIVRQSVHPFGATHTHWLNRLLNRHSGKGELALSDLKGLVGPDGKEVKLAAGHASVARVSIGAAGYQLYTQPLAVNGGGWILGGLARESRVMEQALAVQSYFLLFLLLVALAGLAGWGFLSLATMDPLDRLPSRGVFSIHVSWMALGVVLTVIVMGWDAWVRQEQAYGSRLQSLAQELEKKVLQEIRDAVAQLKAYDDEYAPQGGRGVEHNLKIPSKIGLVSQYALIEPDGQQITKHIAGWEPRSGLTDVSGRGYYQSVVHGDTWRLKDAVMPFALMPGRSMSDGKFYSFVAAYSSAKQYSCSAAGPCVSAMTIQLGALTAQPMPAGMSFAVVNDSGMVLYHSDGRRALRQNLYDEIDEPAALRSALQSRSPRAFASRMRTRGFAFHVRPVTDLMFVSRTGGAQGSGWFIVTMLDTEGLASVGARALVLSILWPLVALMLLFWAPGFGIALQVSRVKYGHKCGWLWPHEGRSEEYQRVLAAGTLVVLAGLASVVWLDGGALAIAGIAIPAAAVGGVLLVFRGPRARAPLKSVWTYLVAIMMVSACLSILPAAAGFKFFWNREAGKVAHAMRSDWETSEVAAREALVQDLPQREASPAADRQKEYLVPRPAWMGEPKTVAVADPLPDFFDDWLPNGSDLAARIRHEDPDPVPAGAPGGGGFSWRVLVVLIVVAGGAWWSRAMLKYLFFADAQAGPEADPRAWKDLSKDEQRILVHAAMEGFVNPKQSDLARELIVQGHLVLGPVIGPGPRHVAEVAAARLNPAEWEGPEAGSDWRRARWILSLFVLGLSAFLLATQPDVTSQFLGWAGALATALGSIRGVADTISAWMGKSG